MSWHLADFACPACSEAHRMATMLQIERGPDRAGTVVELPPGGRRHRPGAG